MKYKFIDLFAGIGGFRIAAEQNNLECVFSSEIDEDARKVMKTILTRCLVVISLKLQPLKYPILTSYSLVSLVNLLVMLEIN